MAIHKLFMAQEGPFLYDDELDINDPDFPPGTKFGAIVTSGVLNVKGQEVPSTTPSGLEAASDNEAKAQTIRTKAIVPANIPMVMANPGNLGKSAPAEVHASIVGIYNARAGVVNVVAGYVVVPVWLEGPGISGMHYLPAYKALV